MKKKIETDTCYAYYNDLEKLQFKFKVKGDNPKCEYVIEKMLYLYYHFIRFYNKEQFKSLFPIFDQIEYSNTYFKNLPNISKILTNYKMNDEPLYRFIYAYNFENMIQLIAQYFIAYELEKDKLVIINFTPIHFIYRHSRKLYCGILNEKELMMQEYGKSKSENNLTEKKRLKVKLRQLIHEILDSTIISKNNVQGYLNVLQKNPQFFERIIIARCGENIENPYWNHALLTNNSIMTFIKKNVYNAFYYVFNEMIHLSEEDDTSTDDVEIVVPYKKPRMN